MNHLYSKISLFILPIVSLSALANSSREDVSQLNQSDANHQQRQIQQQQSQSTLLQSAADVRLDTTQQHGLTEVKETQELVKGMRGTI